MLEFHELANLFPLIEGEEFAALVEDIRAHGLELPIYMYEGKILDGRNRYRACLEAGINPRYKVYEGDSPASFVVSMNKHRRHLTSSQLAFSAVELEKLLAVEAEKRKQATQFGANGGQNNLTTDKGKASAQAASIMGTNQQYVLDAKKVIAHSPELAQQVIAGIKTLPEARREVYRAARAQKQAARLNGNVLPVTVDIRHGDFYAEVKTIPDSSIDLILTDPPYNRSSKRVFTFDNRKDISQDFGEWDFVQPQEFIETFDIWVCEFRRILRKGGSGYVFTSDKYLSYVRAALEQTGLNVKATLYWHKTNPGIQVVQTNYKSSVECILFFTKGDGHTFNWQGLEHMHNGIEMPICGGNERVVNEAGDILHPTQKPVQLLKHLMQISSNPGDSVFDGFAGVGSTGAAAVELGRRFVGIEIDPVYIKAARERIAQVASKVA
ncbi:MAG: DNA modification methylase [Ktedonobacteraceae bacterium]